MTDYKNLKLIASSSPHIRSNESTRTIMMDVIIAMIPALIMSVFVFGFRALALTLVSVAACVFWEWGYRKLLKKPQSIGDLSAVVTGIILALNVPVGMPLGQLIVGDLVAIVVVKQLFGGIGCNFMNPALAGRAVLLASYATAMTTWAVPMSKLSIFGSNADAVTSSTPLAIMKGGDLASLTSNYSVVDMFLGRIGGDIGGGLCQLSNLIFWMTLHTPLTVTERYRHSHDVFPDANRTQPFGSGATCAYPHRDLMIRNDTDRPYQLCLRVGETHLEGAWRSTEPPALQFRVIEKDARIDQASWGGYIRHNQLWREVYGLSGALLEEQYLCTNDAIMMYSPLLSAAPADGE